MHSGKGIRVAINGYGVIGNRVADAVTKWNDTQLAGVTDAAADRRLRVAINRGMPWFGAAGVLEDRLDRVDIVADWTPKSQAIAIPETIDAIRALARAGSDGSAAIDRTHATPGIGTWRR